MQPLHIDSACLRYRGLIGTGGIGTGAFFALEGDHTLGREESRAGRFLDRRDYCKLHIIAHYVSVLTPSTFRTVAVGRVGDDDAGRRMLDEMNRAGIDTRHVTVALGEQTLYSFCFIYPNGEGGNMTVSDSASGRVRAADVRAAATEFATLGEAGIALAAPEVPLEARAELLELATDHGLFRAAAFTSGELTQPLVRTMFASTDLLALNIDEAASVAGVDPASAREETVEAASRALRRIQPEIMVSVTAGARGSWTVEGDSVHHCPALKTRVVSTAGAGDAHFAALLVGLAAGLSLADAHHLAALVAALAVASPHTISPDVDRASLADFARVRQITLPETVIALLREPS